jgi:peptide subunit release factor 1 (eRF1)
LRQYARRVDAALRAGLAGRDTPLILAAADRMASIYRSVNTYPALLDDHIATANDNTSDHDLAGKAREILDQRYLTQVRGLLSTFAERAARGLATADMSDAARAATAGGIDTLLVDIDADIPGLVDDAGWVTFADGASVATYDVVDEIASRALATGARILALRKADLPDGAVLAAILRFAV